MIRSGLYKQAFRLFQGTNHTIVETDGISAQAKVNASYLELPVMVAARFAMDRNTYILVAAGPYGAWGLVAKPRL